MWTAKPKCLAHKFLAQMSLYKTTVLTVLWNCPFKLETKPIWLSRLCHWYHGVGLLCISRHCWAWPFGISGYRWAWLCGISGHRWAWLCGFSRHRWAWLCGISGHRWAWLCGVNGVWHSSVNDIAENFALAYLSAKFENSLAYKQGVQMDYQENKMRVKHLVTLSLLAKELPTMYILLQLAPVPPINPSLSLRLRWGRAGLNIY